jgi:hypothetical protein
MSEGCPVCLRKVRWKVLFRKMGNEKLKLATLSVIFPIFCSVIKFIGSFDAKVYFSLWRI